MSVIADDLDLAVAPDAAAKRASVAAGLEIVH